MKVTYKFNNKLYCIIKTIRLLEDVVENNVVLNNSVIDKKIVAPIIKMDLFLIYNKKIKLNDDGLFYLNVIRKLLRKNKRLESNRYIGVIIRQLQDIERILDGDTPRFKRYGLFDLTCMIDVYRNITNLLNSENHINYKIYCMENYNILFMVTESIKKGNKNVIYHLYLLLLDLSNYKTTNNRLKHKINELKDVIISILIYYHKDRHFDITNNQKELLLSNISHTKMTFRVELEKLVTT